MATTQIADVIVPSVFTPYVRQQTAAKTRMIQAGAMVPDAALNAFLAGGGVTMNSPSWQDLADDADNVSTDADLGVSDSVPKKLATSEEIQVRLSRNQSWSSMRLAAALIDDDPMGVVADRVSNYWARKLQAILVATMKGVFADNDAAPAASEHVAGDLTHDIKGASFVDGTTNFSASGYIDATVTMGDSASDLGVIMVHSVVHARMRKLDLIDFERDSQGRPTIPTYQGLIVVEDDTMPAASGVYDTWMFGPGAIRLGIGSPSDPTEIARNPEAGDGGGRDVLYSRTEICVHPVGHRYDATSPSGGPSNAATTNNLAHAASWMRAWPERKQIKIARFVTREHAP